MPDRPTHAGTLCVLIVEDEPKSRQLMAQWMPDMGFAALEAGTAEQALNLLRTQQVDIAIIDLNLPGMDGMTFFQQLRTLRPKLPVIVVTGYGELDSAQQAIDLDVVAFLSKPCPLGDIEAALSRAVKRLAGDQTMLIGTSAKDEPPSGKASPGAADIDGQPPTLAELEREAIMEALERHNWNRAATAEQLGISVRTLYYRLRQYGQEEPDD